MEEAMRELNIQRDILGQDINIGDRLYYAINNLNNLYVVGKVISFTKDFVRTQIIWTEAPHWERSPAVGDKRRISCSCALNLDGDMSVILQDT